MKRKVRSLSWWRIKYLSILIGLVSLNLFAQEINISTIKSAGQSMTNDLKDIGYIVGAFFVVIGGILLMMGKQEGKEKVGMAFGGAIVVAVGGGLIFSIKSYLGGAA